MTLRCCRCLLCLRIGDAGVASRLCTGCIRNACANTTYMLTRFVLSNAVEKERNSRREADAGDAPTLFRFSAFLNA
ncbi:hypothetical protein PF005_g1458 [Phytophthora fragariae]|uniref:Secreted protein n=2 Tax=Phytophthora TaxID=4783 RepID=A0A6A4AI38_9STRA|nr:hypothetical protein PF009_g1153 [Phytophthora fragariae]KAE9044913.1 hypothetical protein PR002_g2530 [Phytophthora rubi]KAE9029823.1 hypothetical protein PF011_g885 [Phytophthora fragariae]KAE9047259.1 hypothetical protein PR001_g4278 [Phytophthora rubi]KAE9137778.1 hypothetical protein PF010_g1175 [Phytophthora fragariae]